MALTTKADLTLVAQPHSEPVSIVGLPYSPTAQQMTTKETTMATKMVLKLR